MSYVISMKMSFKFSENYFSIFCAHFSSLY